MTNAHEGSRGNWKRGQYANCSWCNKPICQVAGQNPKSRYCSTECRYQNRLKRERESHYLKQRNANKKTRWLEKRDEMNAKRRAYDARPEIQEKNRGKRRKAYWEGNRPKKQIYLKYFDKNREKILAKYRDERMRRRAAMNALRDLGIEIGWNAYYGKVKNKLSIANKDRRLSENAAIAALTELGIKLRNQQAGGR